MATTIGKEKDIVDLLKNLLELEHDAADAYETAIQKLENPDDKAALKSFLEDHRDHIVELNEIRATLGAESVNKGDVRRVLTQGKVILGGLLGDRAILVAMKSNEEDTNTAYERALEHGVPPSIRAVFDRNLRDERRHYAWIVFRLETYYAEGGAKHETQEIAKHGWVEMFDMFSKAHRGWVGTLEVLGPKVGAQIAEEEQPFEGIAADVKSSGGDRVTILLGAEPGAHRDHVVSDPKRVRLRLEVAAAALEIEDHEGVAYILRIHPARELAAHIRETGS